MGLEEIRKNIDAVDVKMRELFLKRMDLSRQVVEEKKRTGAKVYVPKREEEVILGRIKGMEEHVPEYKMFVRQVMAISRIYQYSCLALPESLNILSSGKDKFIFKFSCDVNSEQLLAAFTALRTAGIAIHEMQWESVGETLNCSITISGDFTSELTKAAVLLIYEENEHVSVQKAEE